MNRDFLIAGFPPRIIAVLIDLNLSYLFYSYLLSLDFFAKLYQELFLILVESVPKRVEFLCMIILLYFVYFFMRFYSSLILGQSIGQSLVGIRSSGEGVLKRVKAIFRVSLEFLTSPFFFITDLSILIGKKSFKEKISLSSLECLESKWKIIYGLIFLFLAFTSLYFTPLLTHKNFLSKNNIVEVKIESESISSKTDFSAFRLIPSNHFSFASFTSLKNEELVIVPQYEKMRRENIKIFRPKILFFDRESRQFLNLKQEAHFSWLQKIGELKALHPLFSFYYPQLSKLWKEKKDFKKVNYDGESRGKVFPPEVELEIKRLVKSSFELNFKNSHLHFFKHGPFLNSNFLLKNFFLNKLDSTYEVEVKIMEIGNYFFLSLIQNLTHLNIRQEHLISLSSDHADHYVISSGLGPSHNVFLEEWKKSFLGEIEFFSDYNNVFKLQDFLKDRKDFMIYDLLPNDKIKQVEKNIYAKELVSHLQEKYELCKSDGVLLKECQVMIEDILQVLEHFLVKNPGFWPKDLSIDLKSILNIKKKGR